MFREIRIFITNFDTDFFRRKTFSSKFFSTKVNFRPKSFSTKNYFCLLNRMNGFLEKTIFQYLEASIYFSFVLIKTLGYYIIVHYFKRNLKSLIVTQRKNFKPVHSIHQSKLFFRRKKFSTKKIFDEKNRCRYYLAQGVNVSLADRVPFKVSSA